MENRREFLKKVVIGGVALGAGSLPISLYGAKGDSNLTILHTNDMHSHIEPFPDDGREYAGMGGMARRAAIIEKIRKEEKHVLLLDAGDIFQGTPYFNVFKGELELKLMSKMKYDAATLGNHEFDNGLEGLKSQLEHASFPFINANYDFSKTILANTFPPYKIFEKGNIKVGAFGLGIGLQGLVSEQLYNGTRYIDPVDAAKEMVSELKSKKCDLIICLSHLGFEYESDKISDVKLAQQVTGIDLIIGGHTHTFLSEPRAILNPEMKPVLINQVGWAGINIGRIDYNFQINSSQRHFNSSAMKVH